jgi:hypothetical protein
MSKVLVDRELLARLHGVITDEQRLRVTDVGLVYELLAQPIVSGLVPDVDDLSNFIRGIDGSNKMGAGALAERICDWIASPPSHLSFEQLKAVKGARVNAFLHERQDKLLLDMIADSQSTKEGE